MTSQWRRPAREALADMAGCLLAWIMLALLGALVLTSVYVAVRGVMGWAA